MQNIDRRAFIAFLGGTAAAAGMTADARADALEHYLAANLAEPGAGAGGGGQARAPTTAQVDAQIPTRNYRRGVGNALVAKEGGYRREMIAEIPDRNGRAIFEVFRFVR